MGKRARKRDKPEAKGEEGTALKDAMSEEELRDAGVAIDLPFETPSPAELTYGDGQTFRGKFPHLFEPGLGGSARNQDPDDDDGDGGKAEGVSPSP